MQLNRIEDTVLWQHLDSAFTGKDQALASDLAHRLTSLYSQAATRMKWVPATMPQYTLHDDVHLLRVTELMAKILPADVLNQLNPIEIYVLVLSALFHDQGMVLDDDSVDLGHHPEFQTFRDNWYIDHPNHREVQESLSTPYLSETERDRYQSLDNELRSAMLSEFVRRGHGQRSGEWVRSNYSNDPRLNVAGTNIAGHVSVLCESHTVSTSELTGANGFSLDEEIGIYTINMRYLAIILRLADILDFDRDRTPDSLYRSIHFSSDISLEEWEKHRSVQGWSISEDIIRFTVKCKHPIYQRSVLRFMDWIDEELSGAHNIARSFPTDIATKYYISLPVQVDRTRIEPESGSYEYYDLEFSLSRDEIVKLLMTDQLYGSPSLAVRELLQNSLDALRYRRALVYRDLETNWTAGKVQLRHFVDTDGYEVLSCTDNGIGMDEDIITKFLTRAGRSFYRSPEFQRERESFAAAGVDFDPCAQFGIGFMSVFMIGDRIVIRTRRDHGSAGLGKPLVVEINGLNGMLVVRTGDASQRVGTTVEITGRKKPRHFNSVTDEIRLIPMLKGYALTTEFPVKGECNIPEIASSVDIIPEASVPRTNIERHGIGEFKTFEQEFAEVDSRLGGSIRSSFIVDQKGKLTLENEHAKWSMQQLYSDELWPTLVFTNGEQLKDGRVEFGQVCIDGILVAGEPGRDGQRESLLGFSASPLTAGKENFVLDVRGDLKPEITPARVPLRGFGMTNKPGWRRLEALVNKAQGKLWQQVIHSSSAVVPELIWELMMIYQMDPTYIDSTVLWDSVSVPLLAPTGDFDWRPLSDLGLISTEREDNQLRWFTQDGSEVKVPESLSRWDNVKYGYVADSRVKSVIAGLSVAEISHGRLAYRVVGPIDSSENRIDLQLRGHMFDSSVFLQRYSASLEHHLSVSSPVRSANRISPLATLAVATQDSSHPSAIQAFAQTAVRAMSDPSFLKSIQENTLHHRMIPLGNTYVDVDWSKFSDELAPPYSSLASDGQELVITGEELAKWDTLTWDDMPDPADE